MDREASFEHRRRGRARARPSRIAVIAAVACVAAGACSAAPDGSAPPGSAPSVADAEGSRTADEKRPRRSKKDFEAVDGARAKKGARRAGEKGGGAAPAGAAPPGGTDGGSSAAYPAAGDYVFAQRGYEEFCQGTTCDRQDLPPSQPVGIAHRRSSASSAIVVTEIRASDNRLMRTTTRYDGGVAAITRAYVRFEYRSVRFEEHYVPEPPIEALRFPMTAGERWSGRWKDSTSGSYSVRVSGPQEVSAGGRTIDAHRVETLTEFTGQFEGKSRIVTWIDPATKAVVKTDGVLNVTSAFGRYSTSFETRLSSGPGYR